MCLIILYVLYVCKYIKFMQSARHKTNANYGNLVFDTVEKRLAKNLICDSCWSSSWVKKVF